MSWVHSEMFHLWKQTLVSCQIWVQFETEISSSLEFKRDLKKIILKLCSKFSTYQKVCNQISVISELTKKCAQQILKLLLFFRFFSLEKDHSHLACFWRDHNVSNVLGFDKIPRSAPEGEKSHCKLNISQNLSEISPFFFFFFWLVGVKNT